MKRVAISTFVFLNSILAFTQSPGDTIVVETFNYSQTYGINQWSPGIRDTLIDFSVLPNVSFEKILMSYNIRCKDGNVSSGAAGQTDVGCGEWDISCNTYLHDSTRIDSVRFTHPDYTVSGFTGTTFDYTSQPTYDYFQYTQDPGTLNNIISENQFPLLAGNSTINEVLDGTNNSGKSQFLYTAVELIAAGFAAGDVDGFLVNALTGGQVNFLRVRVKGTSASTTDPAFPELTGFQDVYFSNYNFAVGSNRIQFSTPFNWNGTDNLIVEFSFTNSIAGTAVQLEGTASTNMGIYTNNGYNINLAANTHIDIPTTAMSTINNEISVSFWAYGNPDFLPVNTSIIHANDPSGNRNLNLHLPWSNSRVYFDCGNTGNGYDRIDKAATNNELEGQWHHWAATKNAATGQMKLYLDGVLWHSGTGKTNPIEIAEMVVGKSNALSNNYKGKIDELRVWDTELSQTDIMNWMNLSIDATHPQYSNLVAYYSFDEGTGTLTNDLTNAQVGSISNSGTWQFERGIDLNRGFQLSTHRPNITLVEGTYNSSPNPTVVMDSIQLTPNVIEYFSIVSNPNSLLNDQVVTSSQITVWQAIPQNIFDGNSANIIGTVNVAIENTTPTVTTLEYYRRYPAKIEIMSFVTPYGINLDLGPEGKTWTFDMTDYTPIFNGTKRMTIERGGQWMEDMDIKFLFIVGTPPRDVVDFQQIWRPESRNYQSIMSETYFAPKSMLMSPNGEYFKVRTAISGHGQEGEFIPRIHYIDIDGGANEFSWQVWKQCAKNPVYPQGGTWVYDRAGWCPGVATDVQHNDITAFVTPGQQATIDYGINTATGDSRYIVNSQLITYGAINHTIDAAIVEVSEPSNRVEFERFNSICHEPKIKIQNTGSTALTSLVIKYWVNNATVPLEFNWTGNLAFLETEEIALESNLDLWAELHQSDNVFHVEISLPNGESDEYIHNNHYASAFTIPEVVPRHIAIWFRTNSAPQENSYDVRDENGNIIFQRTNMTANTQYKDTLYLDHGCYSYNVYDSDGDGISWWANNDGNGSTLIRRVGASGIVKTFNGDFGDNIHFNFTTDSPLATDEFELKPLLDVFPNPTSDILNITMDGLDKTVDIELFDILGKRVKLEQVQTVSGYYEGSFSIVELPHGVYIMTVSDGKTSAEIKVIKH